MSEVIAVFDIGKTNKKLLLFNSNFQVVFQKEEKFACVEDEDGFECDDVKLIATWFTRSIAEILSNKDFCLKAINFSTYGASLMFLDENGKPLTPLYNYLKEISPSISESLFEVYGGKNEFCRRTASPSLGLLLNSGIQVLWLQQEKPEIFNQVKAVLHFPQYLSFLLTNKIFSEPTSIGCHTFMWDFDHMKYHQWIKDNNINLPEPVNNDHVFPVSMFKSEFKVGTGIHDSSASLVPYLKASSEKFILVSTGTWCINMNPFNTEPLTAEELAQDCLCYLTPHKEQVKSSRLFMGHFHEAWVEKLANHFHFPFDSYKTVKKNKHLIESLIAEFNGKSEFFLSGKEGFKQELETVDLDIFKSYEEAYTKLMIDLTDLCADSIKLVISENDETEILFISGGFARNEIFIYLIKTHFPDKTVQVSEIDNSSALGAALIIADVFTANDLSSLDLGIKE